MTRDLLLLQVEIYHVPFDILPFQVLTLRSVALNLPFSLLHTACVDHQACVFTPCFGVGWLA